MGVGTLIQVVFDIFVAAGLFIVVMRMNRAPKDDPRLSRGLQLLQSKIAVLEDLSDRTETQVTQLTAILEQKAREVQAKVQLAEQQVHEIRQSMDRSLEVAKIFQDKIPHKEIIERQNTIKYVQAARLAHRGASVDEIAAQVDLPRGEVEFIASVNREQLMFSEEQLPAWAKEKSEAAPSDASFAFSPQAFAATGINFVEENSNETAAGSNEENASRLRAEMELAEKQRLVENLSRLQFEMKNLDMQFAQEHAKRDLAGAFEVPTVETDSLKRLGEEFRKAVEAGNIEDTKPRLLPLDQLSNLMPPVNLAAETMREASGKLGGIASKAYDSLSWVANEALEFSNNVANQAADGAKSRQVIPHPTLTASFEIDEEPPQDPALVRALAQQKIQEALSKSARPQTAPQTSEELKAAREIAKQSRSTITAQPTHLVSSSGSTTKPTVVRKVQFPRIDGSEV
ncbi:MAG TPA: DUF2802 domain-containing protein [Bdellovibrionales bacterium]|nr:DUF2802 domain-containing protein [Bdellovibrionales bacterium]